MAVGLFGLVFLVLGLLGIVLFGFMGIEPLLHTCMWVAGGGFAVLLLGVLSANGRQYPQSSMTWEQRKR